MARRSWGVALAVLAILAAGLACEMPLLTGLEEGAAETAVALTIAAGASEAAPAATVTETLESGPSPVVNPTATATAAASAQLTRGTNCRTGPFRFYDLITTILDGERVEILAQNEEGNYWYVVNPDDPEEGCWLWARYTEVEGDTGVVPVFTPPPTPEYLWTGEWTIWLREDFSEGELDLSQAGDRVDGTVIFEDESDQLAGSISDDDRVVEGEVTTSEGTRFTWMMLENKNQFVGHFTEPGSEEEQPLCGAREGASRPDPCLWPEPEE